MSGLSSSSGTSQSDGIPATLPSALTVTASPMTYSNTNAYPVELTVVGGTVSEVAFSRDNSTFYVTGATAGMFWLNQGDFLKITYSVAFTGTVIPRA